MISPVLAEYSSSMRRRELAAGTIYHRLHTARSWLTHLGALGLDLDGVDRREVERWLDPRPLAARARYTEISNLHMFYVWAQREGLATRDPTVLVERPRLRIGLPRPMPEADVELAVTTAGGELRIMVALMAWAALRCCEVAWLEWGDVDLAAGTLHVTGKGRRERVVPIGARLRAELAALDGTTGPVIGRRITPVRVSQLVNAHLRGCGIEHTAHAFRHRKLTRLCEETGDVLAVQNYAGHASPATTQNYVAVARARVLALALLAD